MEPVIALALAYDGAPFHGWQTQKNAPTVQETLTQALQSRLGIPVSLHGCGRTDAGVHAAVYVASFRGKSPIPEERLPFAVNPFLPEEISLRAAWRETEDFHARFSCLKKRYTYSLYTGTTPDPLLRRTAWFYPGTLDLSRMQAGAAAFVGRQDFAAVRSQGTPVKSTVRTVFDCRVEERGGLIAVSVTGDGFLYNMVRAIVGTLVYVGIGKLAPEEVPALLAGGRREDTGPTAPPHGLCMTGLWYPTFSLVSDWPYHVRRESSFQKLSGREEG